MILTPGEHWITTQKLGNSWAAVEFWMNNVDFDDTCFPEPWNTGFGRYATEAQALDEALEWAAREGIPYIPRSAL